MDYYNEASNIVRTANNIQTWMTVSLILAIIGGILIYVLFVKSKKKQDNKFLAWCKDFFDYKKMLIEDLLKAIYLILAIYITLSSFAYIGTDFATFILTLLAGNVILRLVFEGSLVLIMIWKNTTEINKKLK